MVNNKGYEAGEEESKKIEEIIARRGEPKESIAEDRADYAEDVELAEEVETPKSRFKAEEPILLYVRTGIGTYTVVEQPFESRVAASQFAEENFKGTKYKIYTQSQAIAEGEKQQARLEKIERAKAKAAEKLTQAKEKVGTYAREEVRPRVRSLPRAALDASYDVARSHRMTRPQMEPEIRQAWGVPQSQPQQPGINIQIGTKQYAPKPEPEEYREQRPSYQPSPRQRTRFTPPQQQRTRINIPPGGGVFMPKRRFSPPPERKRDMHVSRGAGVYDAQINMPREPPFKRVPLNFGGSSLHRVPMHMITPRGIRPMGYKEQPYREEPKNKKHHKKRRR